MTLKFSQSGLMPDLLRLPLCPQLSTFLGARYEPAIMHTQSEIFHSSVIYPVEQSNPQTYSGPVMTTENSCYKCLAEYPCFILKLYLQGAYGGPAITKALNTTLLSLYRITQASELSLSTTGNPYFSWYQWQYFQ